VVVFPDNTGPGEATLEIWEIDGTTGYRTGDKPKVIYNLDSDGGWGPFTAKKGQHYEFVLIRSLDDSSDECFEYFYFEPPLRSDYFMRLPTSAVPGEGLAAYMDSSDSHVNLIVGRDKEFWGDQPGYNDILEINNTNIISPATHPIANRVNYNYVYDQGADGDSNLDEPIEYFFKMPFFTGVDLYIPGADPPNDTTSIVLTSRGGSKQQVINILNRASSSVGRIYVQFRDYVQ